MAALLAQLIDDYLDEEQYDTAISLVDECLPSLTRPDLVALLWRRLLCVSLCTTDAALQERQRHAWRPPRAAMGAPPRATYVWPSPWAVENAARLLVRVALDQRIGGPRLLRELPGHSPAARTRCDHVLVAWEAHTATEGLAATPLAFWADEAIPAAFDDVWDLLQGVPSARAVSASRVPLDAPAFWLCTRRTPSDGGADGVCLSAGAWRTLEAIVTIAAGAAEREDVVRVLAGDPYAPMYIKPLALAFSFPHVGSVTADAGPVACVRRARTGAQLFVLVAQYCADAVPKRAFCAAVAQHFAHLSDTDLDLFCDLVLPAHTALLADSVQMLLHMRCFGEDELPFGAFLFRTRDTRDGVDHAAWERTMAWRSSPAPSMDTWFSRVWLKYTLVRLCVGHGGGLPGNLLAPLFGELCDLRDAIVASAADSALLARTQTLQQVLWGWFRCAPATALK
ncbi:hypothetical protein MSPP1_002490 [Malassezia sp. CBS 17886]|nr:hypothetical protein MSPP1_002490 [Malassezia sp. CBS 17886]